MDGSGLNQIQRADPLVERVLAQITDAIVTGRLRPGDQLIETRLSEQLGVSRGPVREAFRRLEQMGLIEKIPYRGAFVSSLTERDIAELHSVRGPLEGLAARLLAERRDPAAIAQLQTILDQMRQAAQENDQGRMVQLDGRFHDALIELSGHKLLGEVWVAVSVRLRRFLLLKRQRLYRTLHQAAPLHDPIVRAIAAGDLDRAEHEARHHVQEAARQMGPWTAGAGENAEVT